MSRPPVSMGAEEVATPVGPALVVVDRPSPRPVPATSSAPVPPPASTPFAAAAPAALLVLGHGAGGGVDAVDLLAVRDAATAAGVVVARVTQPYRVAGRRAPAPAARLDAAWTAVVSWLRAAHPGLPVVVGGRSSGARVACRTAGAVGAVGVVALAFPLRPPRRSHVPRRQADRPPDRSAELATGLPTLLVSGERDPFGVPHGGPGRQVVTVPGAVHDLRADPAAVGVAVVAWLRSMGWAAAPTGASSGGAPGRPGPAGVSP